MGELIENKLKELIGSKEYTIKCAARLGKVAWRKGSQDKIILKDLLKLDPSKSEFYTRC